MFKIGEVSRLLGVDRSFLHYYDQMGIIVPAKNNKNYRLYSETDLIAIASSKYYRAMKMPIKPLTQIIQTSDLQRKVEILHRQKQWLHHQASLFSDLATIADFAIETIRLAYQDQLFSPAVSLAFDFVPLIVNGVCTPQLNEPEVRELLDFFPFVSYAYYFHRHALTDRHQFRYELGLAAIHSFREKYQVPLPSRSLFCPNTSCLIQPLSKTIHAHPFTYDDFEPARAYARQHQQTLSGEAVAYCVFTNYEYEHAEIRFVVHLFTK